MCIRDRRLLNADKAENTMKLRRYILGLALVAFTKLPLAYYRQGTILTLAPDISREFKAVNNDGKRTDVAITHADALAFAQVAANSFIVGKEKVLEFNKEKAKSDLKETKEEKKKAKGKKDSPSAEGVSSDVEISSEPSA